MKILFVYLNLKMGDSLDNGIYSKKRYNKA